MNIAGTSKPVCSVISWKQVGLVTLISVTESPITSSPISSSPRGASARPTVSAAPPRLMQFALKVMF